jgi:hypothetical protein
MNHLRRKKKISRVVTTEWVALVKMERRMEKVMGSQTRLKNCTKVWKKNIRRRMSLEKRALDRILSIQMKNWVRQTKIGFTTTFSLSLKISLTFIQEEKAIKRKTRVKKMIGRIIKNQWYQEYTPKWDTIKDMRQKWPINRTTKIHRVKVNPKTKEVHP